MMQTKRWIVTYTRHVKQKRKVYHDGILELSGSGDKVMLYDDCEKLIDSRFLKHDEVIERGAALAFETHLVDIGEPEENHKPQIDLNVSGRDVKLNERAEAQIKKSTLQSMRPQNYSNVIHSSIKESKKSKLQNRPSQVHSNAIPSSIRVSNKAEIDSNGVLQGRPNATEPTLKEWNVLYTTQITQKAKKYHDGILRLASRSSNMRQVILLSEDGAVLSSKYLKSVDCMETGHSCEFPNYLVEIGDPRVSLGDDLQKGSIKQVATGKVTTIPMKDDNIKTLPDDALQKGPLKQVSSSSSSSSGMFSTTKKNDSNKASPCQIPFILKKLLREDSLGQRNLPVERVNSSYSSQFVQLHSSAAIQVDVHKSKMLELNVPGTRDSRKTVEDYHKGDFQDLSIGGATQTDPSGCSRLNPKASHVSSSSGVTIVIDTDCEGNSAPHESSTSSSHLSRAFVSNASTGKLDTDYNANKCVEVATSAEGPKTSDVSDCIFPRISRKNASESILSDDGLSKEMVDTVSGKILVGKAFGWLSSINLLKENISTETRVISGIGGNGIPCVNNTECENSDKLFRENTRADERCESVAKDDGCKDSEYQSGLDKRLNVDNFPTFDLGF